MTSDVVVIGAGLAGLTSALRLAQEGRRVVVVARGIGATHLGPGTVDVLGYGDDGRVERPDAELPSFVESHPEHPYARVSTAAIADSLEWFKAQFGDYRFVGGLHENFLLPTAAGVAKPSALVPETMAGGDVREGGRVVLVGIRGLKDFYPAYAADNLNRSGVGVSARALELQPPPGQEADVGSLRFARRFDEPGFRAAVARDLAQQLEPDERVGFPAVLGLERPAEVWRELERSLGRRVFEVPTLPPSVPGIRVFETLKAVLRAAGGRLVIGGAVVGAEMRGGRVDGVRIETAGRKTLLRGASFVLASGGFASGGIELDSHGAVRETIFGLPLAGLPEAGTPRFLPDYFGPQPLAGVGVAVDERLRPVDGDGRAVYENVHAAGAVIAGAVPWREKSGDGISLATGYAAAASVLAHEPALARA